MAALNRLTRRAAAFGLVHGKVGRWAAITRLQRPKVELVGHLARVELVETARYSAQPWAGAGPHNGQRINSGLEGVGVA